MTNKSKSNREFIKEDFIILAFAKKQIFNEHIKGNNNQILVNVALPSTAKYAGYYITVNKDKVKDDKYRDKMSYFRLYKDASKQIMKYNKNKKERHQLVLSARELKEEFDSWRTDTSKVSEQQVSKNDDVNVDLEEKEWEVM